MCALELAKIFDGIKIGENQTGTITTFLPDKQIFGEIIFESSKAKSLLRDRAYLMGGLSFHFQDSRNGEVANYYFEGGITSLVEKLNENKGPLHEAIFIQKQESDVEVETSLQYNNGYAENVQSYVNVINTVNGGTHLTGFRMALTRAINDYGKKIGSFKDEGDYITGDDTKEGLSAVVFIKMPQDRIQFEGQTKGKLGNTYVRPLVQKSTYELLSKYFEENPIEAKATVA